MKNSNNLAHNHRHIPKPNNAVNTSQQRHGNTHVFQGFWPYEKPFLKMQGDNEQTTEEDIDV